MSDIPNTTGVQPAFAGAGGSLASMQDRAAAPIVGDRFEAKSQIIEVIAVGDDEVEWSVTFRDSGRTYRERAALWRYQQLARSTVEALQWREGGFSPANQAEGHNDE